MQDNDPNVIYIDSPWTYDYENGEIVSDHNCYWCRDGLDLEVWVKDSGRGFVLCRICFGRCERGGEPPSPTALQRTRTKVYHLTPAVRHIEGVTDLITSFLKHRWQR